MVSNTNNRYDAEFRAHAVNMVVEKGLPVSRVAKDLGVSQPTLRRWVRKSSEPEDANAKRIAALEAQTKELQKELADARETVELLKKSVAIFLKP